MKVFDVHIHYGWWGRLGEKNSIDGWLDELRAACAKTGIVKVGLLGWPTLGNEAVAEAIEKHPGFIYGMAMLDMDQEHPRMVNEYHQRGFTGLKIIRTAKNYDNESYYEFYQRAESLNMPILFHTGIIGGSVDYLMGAEEDAFKAIPQGADEERLVQNLKDRFLMEPYGKSSARMQPIYLDTVATYFPKLYMIGAHLGWPDYMTACAVARWRPRLFFDISGGDVVQRHILEGRYIGREIRPDKLVYGSDCDLNRLADNVLGWKKAFDDMGMAEEDQKRVFYDNAARIFGVGEE